MNTSKVVTDRYVHDVYPFAGGGASDPRSALPPRCHVVEHARRRPGSASGNDVASRLHCSYKQGDRDSTEDDPFALVPPVPGVQHNAGLRAGGTDAAPNLHNTAEGNSLRFRWNGSYPDSSGTSGYRTLYLLSGQQTTNTATVMHVGARHYSPSLRRWLQRDPIDLLGGHPNMYQHCFGDSVQFVDPLGYQTDKRESPGQQAAKNADKNIDRGPKDCAKWCRKTYEDILPMPPGAANSWARWFADHSEHCQKVANDKSYVPCPGDVLVVTRPKAAHGRIPMIGTPLEIRLLVPTDVGPKPLHPVHIVTVFGVPMMVVKQSMVDASLPDRPGTRRLLSPESHLHDHSPGATVTIWRPRRCGDTSCDYCKENAARPEQKGR
ncbi:MAG: hypothetical protein AMXMBFR61_04260 [Fimbriimonadales bacterium]